MKFIKISKSNHFNDYFGIKAIKERLDNIEHKLQYDSSLWKEKTFNKTGDCFINIKEELLKLEKLVGIR